MWRNYFITALRNFLGNKVQGLIQVVSLAIGISASLFIGLYILHEFTTDKFNTNLDRIYRVEYGNQVGLWPAIGHQIAQEIPEVEKVVRLINWSGKERIFSSPYSPSDDSLDVRQIEFTGYYWCDSTIFDIFTIPLLQGDPHTALRDPHTCVISETVARKFFPDRDPVGEVLWGGGLVITGVFKEIKKSHIDLNMLISMVSFDSIAGFKRGHPGYLNDYLDQHYMTYVLVNEGLEGSYLEAKIDEHFKQKWNPGDGYEFEHAFRLRPLRDIYFANDLEGESNTFNHGNLSLLRILMVIALSVLALGIINYMNLTTARSTLRAKEVGIRKVAGSSMSHLFIQFQTEAVLVAFFSFVAGIILITVSMPGFRNLTSTDLELAPLTNALTWFLVFLGIVLLGILSGTYPALVISGFKPVETLYSRRIQGRGSLIIRRILLTFQFTVCIMLIIGVTVIFKQLAFMKQTDPEFNTELVVNFRDGSFYWQNEPLKRDLIRERLLQFPSIQKVSFSSLISGDEQTIIPEPRRLNGMAAHTAWLGIDPEFLNLMEIDLVAGRNFNREIPADFRQGQRGRMPKILVNETFIRAFDLEPVGPQIITWDGGSRMEILGIIKDFHFNSLHQKIQPIMFSWQVFLPVMSIKLSPGYDPEVLRSVQSELHLLFPVTSENLFKFSFLDETYLQQYSKDEQTARIILNFVLVAILLAALGLFALASFMATRRTKEIGIRKAFGASGRSVLLLLSLEYMKWVLLSVTLASPLAWIILNRWLQSYAYRTGISWWVFVLAFLFALLITFATVTWQSLKTARTNPVDSLRYE
jgi:putative ABC transport system permease protein